ncbi:filamentous hemagglutinin N-terminal domain-containing protein [Chroogloeocystis siderophila]|uniref:Filamentous haemagglutinin FhaB/tRNA nuclease CdiA-like TPS domain-containing protein n=1 Tax=Chroogloeocystis siderophila 5.2 s.c.1 TaxID=247279 RepID=A0A1U7HN78_9CHRO|nr:filamentous hemagglutinin N-terminal domain-containing protein [Chroogloeocystis siderophila]OKH25036.1 hypothetical protein NIES1031_14395 [Chroogloeocystis siderophila 5.2 s.c.1]
MTNSKLSLSGLQLVHTVIVGAIALSPTCAQAQITPDTTLGSENSVVSPNVVINGTASERIDGGATRGANLFHSFQEFNIDAGRGAYFSNPAGIENILSRVTGNNPSNILGTLGVLGNANLFLMNPNGIIFGQDASLNVAGSFVATTANAIGFGEQGLFNASSPNVPSSLLTVSPSAFLFNQINASSIENRSTAPAGLDAAGNSGYFGLRVPDGESLLLVGGDITADGGGIVTFGGRVDLAAVAGTGSVSLEHNGNNFSLSVPDNLSRADVSLKNAAGFIVAGGGGGDIAIAAQNISILEGSGLYAGILSNLGSNGAQAGDITLDAQGVIAIANSGIFNTLYLGGLGNSGNIYIEAEQLNIQDNAAVQAVVNGQGNTSNILIKAKDSVEITDGGFLTNQVHRGTGNAGDITIETGRLSIRDGFVQADTFGQGNGDNLFVQASDSVEIIGNSWLTANVNTNAVGQGGNLTIDTGSLFVTNGAQIQALTFGQGNAGKVTITARDSVSFDGRENGVINGSPSGAFSIVGARGTGSVGGLEISANSLSITNRAQLGSWTSGIGNAGDIVIQVKDQVLLLNSMIINEVSDVGGSVGNGGDIRISTGSLVLKDGSALLADTENQGNAGSITIEARDTVILEGVGPNSLDVNEIIPSQISTTVERNAVGEGGNIRISTGLLSMRDGGFIATDTYGQGNAGDLTIKTSSLSLDSAQISASTSGNGNAGNLTVRASDSVVLNGEYAGENGQTGVPGGLLAQVEPNTGKGRGGNLTLETGRLSISNGSKVQVATLGQGDAGELEIDAADIQIFNTLDPEFFTGIFAGIIQDPRSQVLPRGNGGKLTLTTERLSIRNGGRVEASTSGEGNGGDIFVNAKDFVEVVGTNQNNAPSFLGADVSPPEVYTPASPEAITGNSGNLTLHTQQLSVRDGGRVSVSTYARGNAGELRIQASDLLVIGTTNNGLRSTVSAGVERGAIGNGGDLTITTERMSVRGGARVSVQTDGTGNAGTLQINAPGSLEIVGISADGQLRSELSAAVGSNSTGRGGNLKISTGQLSIREQGLITTQSQGQQDAGNIELDVQGTLQANNGEILTNASQASGGEIFITAQDIRLHGDSDIQTNVASGTGGGGNITLTANSILAFDDSDILAFAQDGRGGNITLNTPVFFGENFQPAAVNSDPNTLDSNNRADINATGAVAGVVDIPDVSFIQNSLTELPANLTNTETLVANSCVARSRNQAGSFLITGAGGLPSRPGEQAASTYSTGSVRSVSDTSSRTWQLGDPIVEPQAVYRLSNGQLILSRECS